MNVLGYYPGCSLGGTAREYDLSLRAVAGKMDVQLKEVPGWVCCGASSAHATDHAAGLALAADTLGKASAAGMDKVLAPCAMCYSRLAGAKVELAHKPELAQRLGQTLGTSAGNVTPLSILQWLVGIDPEQIKQRITRPLTGLKVACYYGCLLVRPPAITGSNPADVENPQGMQKIIAALGGQSARWTMATECCGGSFALSNKPAMLRLVGRVVESARKAGAACICLACPMCHANLDTRQAELGIPADQRLPVVYLTQLMGLAMGVSEDELGFKGHFVRPDLLLVTAAGASPQSKIQNPEWSGHVPYRRVHLSLRREHRQDGGLRPPG